MYMQFSLKIFQNKDGRLDEDDGAGDGAGDGVGAGAGGGVGAGAGEQSAH